MLLQKYVVRRLRVMLAFLHKEAGLLVSGNLDFKDTTSS